MPPCGLERRDKAKVSRLVVRIALEHAQVETRRGVRVAAGRGVVGQRANDLGVDRPRLFAERDRPVLVGVLLEKVSAVGRLGRSEARGRVGAARPLEGKRVECAREERLDVEGEILGLQPDCALVRADVVVLREALPGIEDAADRAQQDGQSVAERPRALLRA